MITPSQTHNYSDLPNLRPYLRQGVPFPLGRSLFPVKEGVAQLQALTSLHMNFRLCQALTPAHMHIKRVAQLQALTSLHIT